jgi:ABC-type lipoprotein export system ATPase subunit
MVDIAGGATTREFPRGSEWRRWDLQVHTPYSELNNGFGHDFEAYAKALFRAAIARDIHAIGVTDYFSVEGYRRLKALVGDERRLEALLGHEDAAKAQLILLLPNIELRTTPLIVREGRADSRVNLHVLFSEELDVESIEENFLRVLRFKAEAGPGRGDESFALTPGNLEDLGRRLKIQHERFREHTDLYVGMMNAVIPLETLTEALEHQPSRFEDRYLLVLPPDEDLSEVNWDGQGHLTRKLLIQKAQMFFSANPRTREFGLGLRHPSVADFKAEFKSLKPCIHSSDAHDYDHLFQPDGGRQTWIKGDLTFRGLRQLLAEPENRVFIGELPPSLERIRTRPTRVLRRLQIHKVAGSTLAEQWFDTDIELNPELVAIIGKKGSGKSALADALGLLGNTPRYDAFSFLSPRNFRNPQNGKAHHFEASLEWADAGHEGPRRLDRNPDGTGVEKIKYIPQSYLEEICTEVGAGSASRFYHELQQAIFSHVPDVERLGSATLDGLLASLGQEIERAVELTQDELRALNGRMVALEAQLEPEHRRGIEQQLAERERELAAHLEITPIEVVAPDQDATTVEEAARVAGALATARADLAALETQLAALNEEDGSIARKEARATALIDRMGNLKHLVDNELVAAAPDFASVGVEAKDVVTFAIDVAPLTSVANAIRLRRAEIARLLKPDVEGTPARALADLGERTKRLQSELSEPQRLYQVYLAALHDWQTARAAIEGPAEVPGTIAFFHEQLNALDGVPESLTTLKRRRRHLSLEIYRDKQRLRGHYQRYYGPVQDFLQNHPLAASEDFRLTFEASITEEGFQDKFLALINQRRTGPFTGIEDGRTAIAGVLAHVNWASGLSVVRFAESLIASMGTSQGRRITLASQLLQGVSVQDLYDLVFGLGYLKPIYELRWDGRAVDELSPGERGDLLLIFYLLIDRDDIPLVLDQPEENLDNQTIVGTLVPCMRDAKKRRQVIMVTHNPNLAVVCDADQVVCAAIQRDAGNRVIYESGSIENPATNDRIVDILEGTRPAFDQRGARYQG